MTSFNCAFTSTIWRICEREEEGEERGEERKSREGDRGDEDSRDHIGERGGAHKEREEKETKKRDGTQKRENINKTPKKMNKHVQYLDNR